MSRDDPALNEAIRRAEGMLEELNQRIARLALVLGVPLDDPLEFEKILNRQVHYLTLDAQTVSGLPSREHRLVREWEELRGLLVLRCDLMTENLNELGLASTMQITTHVESRLRQEGFTPGADGFDLFRQDFDQG